MGNRAKPGHDNGSAALASRLGIVVGLATEARIARALGCELAIGGGDAAGADVAVRSLLARGCRGLVSFGLAGGLQPGLRAGELIVPGAVIVDGVHFATDAALARWLGGVTPHLLLGADAVIADVAAKRVLFQATGAAAVDLESGAVVRLAAAQGLPFAVLRAVCDPAERMLPEAAVMALDARGSIAVGRVLRSLVRQPQQLGALLRLGADAAQAKRALRERVRQIALAPP